VTSPQNGGRGAARNRGAKAATASTYIFLDSDCVPTEKSFFQRHAHYHQLHPHSVLIGYTYTPTNENDDAYIQFRFGHPVPSRPTIRSLTPGDFSTGNASMEAEDFWKLGGFSEQYHLYEDVELALRMYHAGAKFFQDESILIHHLDKFVRLSRDMKRNYIAYQGSVHKIIYQNPENLSFLPLANRFTNRRRDTLDRIRYEVMLPLVFRFVRALPDWTPRPLMYIAFNFLIVGAAYCGFWKKIPDFFTNLEEY
jgi:GT2 family glycosyltransferase